jgi:hypothetical protein
MPEPEHYELLCGIQSCRRCATLMPISRLADWEVWGASMELFNTLDRMQSDIARLEASLDDAFRNTHRLAAISEEQQKFIDGQLKALSKVNEQTDERVDVVVDEAVEERVNAIVDRIVEEVKNPNKGAF